MENIPGEIDINDVGGTGVSPDELEIPAMEEGVSALPEEISIDSDLPDEIAIESDLPDEISIDSDLPLDAPSPAARPPVHAATKSKRAINELSKSKEATVANAWTSGVEAQKDYFNKSEDNWFFKGLYGLSLGDQMVARQVVNALEESKNLTPEQAKDLLARQELHPSDIVDFYWKGQYTGKKIKRKVMGREIEVTDEEDVASMLGRVATGFIADVFLDPTTYLSLGTNIPAKIAGKTIAGSGGKGIVRGISKLSKTEQAVVRGAGKIETVLTSSGELKRVGEPAKKALVDLAERKIGFDDFAKQANLTDESRALAENAWKGEISEKAIGQGLIDGDKVLTLGVRIPFTNIGKEVQVMPKAVTQLLGLGVRGMSFMGIDVPDKLLRKTQFGEGVANWFRDFKTNTGNFLFDDQIRKFHGEQAGLEQETKKFEEVARSRLGKLKKNLSEDQFNIVLKDMVDDLEHRPLDEAEAAELYQRLKGRSHLIEKEVPIDNAMSEHGDTLMLDLGDEYNGKVKIQEPAKDFKHATTWTDADTQRAQRLKNFPEVEEMLVAIREQNADLMNRYRERGLPGELDPFGPGWSRRYLKHKISREWFEVENAIRQGEEAMDTLMPLINVPAGRVDASALRREYRGGIGKMNEETMKKFGVKVFIDDPLELASMRAREMEKVIQTFDLFESSIDYATKGVNPGAGWMKFNIDDFKHLVLDGLEEVGEDGKIVKKIESFLPKYFTTGEAVYLPENVLDRLMFMTRGHDMSERTAKIMTGFDAFNRLFRNNALFGVGYQGMNFFSNLTTYFGFNRMDEGIQNLVGATDVLLRENGSVTIRNADGGKVKLTHAEFLQEAIEDNILETFAKNDMDFGKLAEHISSNREARNTIGQKAKSLADIVYLWKMNRQMAHVGDVLPRMATYLQYRKNGFSRDFARDAVEKYYYAFNIVSRNQDQVRKLIPFSTFPMKTVEMAYQELSNGRLKGIMAPYKAQRILEGEFVEDEETRAVLEDQMPAYYRDIAHKIHGPLMPGQREMFFEMPFVTNVLPKVFSQEVDTHPLFDVIKLIGAARKDDSEFGDISEDSLGKIAADYLDLITPVAARELFAVAEINGWLDSDHFSRKYRMPLPTPIEEQSFETARLSNKPLTGNPRAMRFENAYEFGQAVEKSLGQDWLYKQIFPTRLDPQNDSLLIKEEHVMRGEYIRKHFRDLTFGLAKIDTLDKNFLANVSFLTRQIRKKEDSIKQQLIKAYGMVDVGKIKDPKFLENIGTTIPEAKELIALDDKVEVIKEYYDFLLNVNSKDPFLFDNMFGPVELDYADKPDGANYVHPDPRRYSDDMANDRIDNIILKDDI